MDAKQAQLSDMRNYMASCQTFFEKLFSEMLLEKPEDPHAFLSQKLERMTAAERDALRVRIRENRDVETAAQVQVIVTFHVVEGKKAEVLSILQEIRDATIRINECKRYEVFQDQQKDEVCALQTWENQHALDNYYGSEIFRQAGPKFKGLLTAAPESKHYIQAAKPAPSA